MTFRGLLNAGVRRAVLGTPGVGTVGRRWRGRQLERQYLSVRRYYERRTGSVPDALSLLEHRTGARLARLRRLDRSWHIMYVGTDHEQDRSGLLRGLATIGVVAPFCGPDGTYGQRIEGGTGDPRGEIGRSVYRAIGDRVRQTGAVDVVCGQMWHGLIDGKWLSRARRDFGCIVVNIAMDDRHTFISRRRRGVVMGTRPLIPHIDLALTAAPEAVTWYLREACPALYFPEASDENLFLPRDPASLVHDICFVGQKYGVRERYVRVLRAAGLDVATFGHGWPAGRLALERIPDVLSGSKIVLGIGGVGQSGRLMALKLRDFDATMAGSCYVTHENPDLCDLFVPGEEIILYRNESDLLASVRLLLSDDERRGKIAAAARVRARADHTWSSRFAWLKAFLLGRQAGSQFPCHTLCPILRP